MSVFAKINIFRQKFVLMTLTDTTLQMPKDPFAVFWKPLNQLQPAICQGVHHRTTDVRLEQKSLEQNQDHEAHLVHKKHLVYMKSRMFIAMPTMSTRPTRIISRFWRQLTAWSTWTRHVESLQKHHDYVNQLESKDHKKHLIWNTGCTSPCQQLIVIIFIHV